MLIKISVGEIKHSSPEEINKLKNILVENVWGGVSISEDEILIAPRNINEAYIAIREIKKFQE